MISYLKILRIPNLLIVALLQYIMYFNILLPIFESNGIESVFEDNMFPLFILITVLIAASGNVINDIVDVDIDKINKPDKWYVGNDVSIKNAYILYFLLILFGLVLAIWIAIFINHLEYLVLFILSIVFLFIYSKYLKKTIILGNVLVSSFSAGVIGVILVFEYYKGLELLKINETSYIYISNVYIGFMLFSFFTSLYREVVKDIEDVEGDRIAFAKTLPVVIGIQKSKKFVYVVALILFVLVLFWVFSSLNVNNVYSKIYIYVVLLPLLIFTKVLLIRANDKKDFGKLSKMIKLLMLSGIILLFFY